MSGFLQRLLDRGANPLLPAAPEASANIGAEGSAQLPFLKPAIQPASPLVAMDQRLLLGDAVSTDNFLSGIVDDWLYPSEDIVDQESEPPVQMWEQQQEQVKTQKTDDRPATAPENKTQSIIATRVREVLAENPAQPASPSPITPANLISHEPDQAAQQPFDKAPATRTEFLDVPVKRSTEQLTAATFEEEVRPKQEIDDVIPADMRSLIINNLPELAEADEKIITPPSTPELPQIAEPVIKPRIVKAPTIKPISEILRNEVEQGHIPMSQPVARPESPPTSTGPDIPVETVAETLPLHPTAASLATPSEIMEKIVAENPPSPTAKQPQSAAELSVIGTIPMRRRVQSIRGIRRRR